MTRSLFSKAFINLAGDRRVNRVLPVFLLATLTILFSICSSYLKSHIDFHQFYSLKALYEGDIIIRSNIQNSLRKNGEFRYILSGSDTLKLGSGGDQFRRPSIKRQLVKESESQADFLSLQNRIIQGGATFEELLYSLTDKDLSRLSNNLHAMSLYQDDPRVVSLLSDIWLNNRRDALNISWAELSLPYVRVALATTLARIDNVNFIEYYEFVISNIEDVDSQVRANSAIGLGLIGAEQEILRLKEMVVSDPSIAVAANAATALFFFDTEVAIGALEDLLENPAVSQERKEIVGRLFVAMSEM